MIENITNKEKLSSGWHEVYSIEAIYRKEVRIMKEIGHLDISDTKRVVLSISQFRGSERIDVREHYLNSSGNYGHTKRGINFNSEHLEDFVKLINKLNDI
jgi:hypothetical protein